MLTPYLHRKSASSCGSLLVSRIALTTINGRALSSRPPNVIFQQDNERSYVAHYVLILDVELLLIVARAYMVFRSITYLKYLVIGDFHTIPLQLMCGIDWKKFNSMPNRVRASGGGCF
ncbi:hypothetical protein TNCV_3091591 [Trichonephila clavipes]|nr:hypothetical protein TNCV_3091591 [Trichonephila clavipes]